MPARVGSPLATTLRREERSWLGQAAGQADRVPGRPRGHRAGRADRAVEGGRGRRAARPSCCRPETARSRPSTTSTRATRSRSTARSPTPTPSDYDGLVLPGGVANPDFLRTDEDAVAFVRAFFEQAKPVGGDLPRRRGRWSRPTSSSGRTLTSWPSLQTDLRNAGATWVDEEVLVDQGLVTSRKPDDLPAFCAKIVEEFVRGRARRAGAAASSWPSRRRDPRHRRHARRHELPPRASRGSGRSAQHGVVLPIWRIHRHIGMGGDQLVAALAGEEFDARAGRRRPRGREGALHGADRRGRAARGRARADRRTCSERGPRGRPRLLGQAGRGRPLPRPARRARARRRLDDLRRRRATKPEPDLVAAALEKAGGGRGGHGRRLHLGLRGRQARRRGDGAVLMGGFSEGELREAGAACVFDSLVSVRQNLAQTPLG